MSWTDENKPITNNELTNYEELELASAKLQKKHEENNGLLRLNNRKLDRLEKTMNNTLDEERTANKNYRSRTLRDIGNGIKKQHTFFASYTQGRIQATMDLQIKKLHQVLLNRRSQEQKKALIQRLMDILAPLCYLVLTLLVFWLV